MKQARIFFMVASACSVMPALADESLLNFALEDLLKVEIISASRKMQQVQDVAAAVSVISREDIERSGARTVPEALRLAPGVEVARIGNNRWAVSMRGFNGRFANKLLVLKDGLSVYSPLFGGVIWEAEDAILGDIERIEVIRGPNAAMWGFNAVNGVINIISRPAAETQGTEAIASVATDEAGALTLRHGFRLGDGHVRIAAKGFDLAPAKTTSGDEGNDSWRASRIGLRGDWPAADSGRWMLFGAAYHSDANDRLDLTRYNTVPPLVNIGQANRGSYLVLRREHALSGNTKVDWQVSAETSAVSLETLVREERDTVAGEFQRRTTLEAHDMIWGGSYRYSHDHLELQAPTALGPNTAENQHRDRRLASLFTHDDLVLIPQQLRLSGGIRLDHDNWSGAQFQPDIRLAWTPAAGSTGWTSLSRAARTPSRLELDAPYQVSESAAAPPFVPAIATVRLPPAADSLKAEIVTSLEAGWRQRVNAQLSVDFAAFVSDYSALVTMTTQAPQWVSPTLVLLPLTSNNDARARTHGFEVAADWQVTPGWRIQPHYSRLRLHSPRLTDLAAVAVQEQWEGRVARHRASLRSSWTLGDGQHLDLWLKYTSRLDNPQVPAYTALDLRYALRLGSRGELAIVGQNLLDQRHPEFVSDYLPIQQTEVGRSLSLKVSWRF